MYELNAHKIRDGALLATATVKASSRRVLLDHLEASALRNGFVVGDNGDLLKGGQFVGSWNIAEIDVIDAEVVGL